MLTDDTKVVLLLCGKFGGEHKPLTLSQYNKLGRWLVAKQLRPADLLQFNDWPLLAQATGLEPSRVSALLARSTTMALTVEQWQRHGIWIISRSDSHYPTRLKQQLKDKAPALLYGIGDIGWLNQGGVGFVGSRNVDTKGQLFTEQQAQSCAAIGKTIISGAARGVDKIAMLSANEAGGNVIGIVAERLLKQASASDFRKAIANKQLVLISPYEPEANFTVAQAMGRNKLIYGLADLTLVVSAEQDSGGTWAGASEALKNHYSKQVCARTDAHAPKGNFGLIELGAQSWPQVIKGEMLVQRLASAASVDRLDKANNAPSQNASLFTDNDLPTKNNSLAQNPIYQSILPILLDALTQQPDIFALSEQLHVTTEQLRYWLDLAVTDGLVNHTSDSQYYINERRAI